MASGTALNRRPESIGVQLSLEQQDFIIASVLENKTYTQMGRELNIPPHWIADYCVKDPQFDKRIRATRDVLMHSMVQSLIGITANCKTMPEVQAARVESDNIKWSASKLIPSIYGDNLNINVTHLDLSSVLLAAENRVMSVIDAKSALVVDAEVCIDDRSSLRIDSGASILGDHGDIPAELEDLI